MTLRNICTVVPDGVVMFFSSYDMETRIMDAWEKSGLLDQIKSKKHLFREPRATSDVDKTIRMYKHAIERNTGQGFPAGALLSCVMGGKMSEGINFSDALGRYSNSA